MYKEASAILMKSKTKTRTIRSSAHQVTSPSWVRKERTSKEGSEYSGWKVERLGSDPGFRASKARPEQKM